MTKALLIIDPQFDFCDPSGALYVPGADKDMERLSAYIDKHSDNIDDIYVTLDTHHKFDVAHPTFWVDVDGNHPAPFTMITSKDIESGKWKLSIDTSIPGASDWISGFDALDYTKSLEEGGKYSLIIWPEHCLIGSVGHSIHSGLFNALMRWSDNGGQVTFVNKGANQFTEHYSAIMPEVMTHPDDANNWIIKELEESDEIIIAGEALSHCVAATVTDIADGFDDEDNIKKLTLLEDCTSSVTGFEKNGQDFVNAMVASGMVVKKSI